MLSEILMLLRYDLGKANAAKRIETTVMVTLDRGFRHISYMHLELYDSIWNLISTKENK